MAVATLAYAPDAHAEFFAPPLPPSSYYEVGVFQMDSGISFGSERLEPVRGIRFQERNGIVSKAMIAFSGGMAAAAMEPGDTVVTGVSRSTGSKLVDVVDPTGHKVGSAVVDVETTTITTRSKTAEERAADARAMAAFNEGMGHLIGLPWSTEVQLIPNNDDGKLHGGSFALTVSFGGDHWWIDMGISGERYAVTLTDKTTGVAKNHRYRSVSVPLRLTISPVAWFIAEAEIRPNFVGLRDRDSKSDIDHSTTWRAGVVVGIPYFEYVYARAGIQKTTITGDRPIGTYVELGARF